MQILDLRALVWEIIGNIRAATASVSGCTAAPEVGYQPNVSANVSDLIYDWNTIYARSMVPAGRVLLNDESLRDGLQSPSGTGSGQAQVQHVDADPFHQVEDIDLLLNGRITHRGRLEAVAQRLVIQQHSARRHHGPGIDRVPVVNEIRNFGRHVSSEPHVRRPTHRTHSNRCGSQPVASNYLANQSYCFSFSSPGLAVSVNPKMD